MQHTTDNTLQVVHTLRAVLEPLAQLNLLRDQRNEARIIVKMDGLTLTVMDGFRLIAHHRLVDGAARLHSLLEDLLRREKAGTL